MGNTASGESEMEDVNQNTFIPPIENEVQYEDTIGSIQKKINKVNQDTTVGSRLFDTKVPTFKKKKYVQEKTQ